MHRRLVYWTYTYFENTDLITNWTKHQFIPDRTISFGASNTLLQHRANCDVGPQFEIDIEGYQGKPATSDAFYGPRFTAVLTQDSGTAQSFGSGFGTHPSIRPTSTSRSRPGT